MRRRAADSPSLRGPVACCLLAVVALSLGPAAESSVRSAVRDAARPGFLLARRLSEVTERLDLARWPWTKAAPIAASPSGQPQVIDTASELELRRLRAEVADLKHTLAAFDASLGPIKTVDAASDPAAGVERIAARVLDAASGNEAGGLIVSAGISSGVAPARPVVAPVEVSAGKRDGVPEGATVLAGAAVLGRTDEVGTLTSMVLPVTASAFRAHVWIVRTTGRGPAFGEEGVLEGDGRGGCVVKYVPSTEAVAVGDHVYSHDPTGRIPQPLYYGRIDRAELRDGAPHWDIHVRPAADARRVGVVHVLRVQDPATLQANAK